MAAFAVCVSCELGKKNVWSRVASIDLTGTFGTLFHSYNKDPSQIFLSAHVSVGPSGPWQDVSAAESLGVLRDLHLRHILFKVSGVEPEVVDQVQ
jgi:hypothetical protein